MAYEKPVRLARPTAREWAELGELFGSKEDIAWLFRLLKISNRLELSRLPMRFSYKWIQEANSILRTAPKTDLRRFRLCSSDKTIDKPKRERVVHLFEIETSPR